MQPNGCDERDRLMETDEHSIIVSFVHSHTVSRTKAEELAIYQPCRDPSTSFVIALPIKLQKINRLVNLLYCEYEPPPKMPSSVGWLSSARDAAATLSPLSVNVSSRDSSWHITLPSVTFHLDNCRNACGEIFSL